MEAIITSITARGASQWLTGPLILVLSSMALVASAQRLDITGSHLDDLLTDEMYKDEIEWRPPPMYESEWRTAKKNQKAESRIQFGYDSAYEELRYRDHHTGQSTTFEHERTKPNTLMRIRF
jgi:hypothetical protein